MVKQLKTENETLQPPATSSELLALREELDKQTARKVEALKFVRKYQRAKEKIKKEKLQLKSNHIVLQQLQQVTSDTLRQTIRANERITDAASRLIDILHDAPINSVDDIDVFLNDRLNELLVATGEKDVK